jgi:intracellular sulfur oxidation DsrE/DsrF family protein
MSRNDGDMPQRVADLMASKVCDGENTMSILRQMAKIATIGVFAVLLVPIAAAEQGGRYWVPKTTSADPYWRPSVQSSEPTTMTPAAPLSDLIKTHPAPHRRWLVKSSTRRLAAKQSRIQSSLAAIAPIAPISKTHRLILQVNTNDQAAMNLALNNATNVAEHYRELGEVVKIEVVTFGPGLHMLRDDTSPVKARLEQMALSTPEVSFKACGNTQEKMHQAEHKDIPIVSQAQVVKSGVVRVMELQEKGWSYVKP